MATKTAAAWKTLEKPPKKEKRPKRYLKRSTKPIKKSGKRTKQWTSVRALLKKEFFSKGITTCQLRYEGCWIDNGLGFAHSKRRNKIVGDEISECILACNFCHEILDRKPRIETEIEVKQIRAETL